MYLFFSDFSEDVDMKGEVSLRMMSFAVCSGLKWMSPQEGKF